MKRSELFTKTSKTTPADEVSRNAQLLIRAGYVYKEMAGAYAYLPLGLKVIEKIKQVVREEMNAIGGQELIMTNLQERETWEITGRWDEAVVDVWFKTKLQDGTELGLAWSHEEPIMKMASQYVQSYRDLPFAVYQFQTKLRNELRAKSGIMRGREFVMKDMYSLHATKEDSDAYYERVKQTYTQIFERLGLGSETFITFASGGAFTKFSHEFQTICEAGEDWLYLDRERNIGVNEEVLEAAVEELGLDREKLEKVRSAEVGNIFNFGTDKAEAMGITYKNDQNRDAHVYLNSYGIGVNRVMGVLVEKLADEKGIVWPEEVAPFRYYLVGIGEAGTKLAEELYQGREVQFLYDDRDARPGEKFADSELMGIPYRVVISDKSLAAGGLEVTTRATGETKILTKDEFVAKIA
jgi:prolyl-tRNA synthetase